MIFDSAHIVIRPHAKQLGGSGRVDFLLKNVVTLHGFHLHLAEIAFQSRRALSAFTLAARGYPFLRNKVINISPLKIWLSFENDNSVCQEARPQCIVNNSGYLR